MNDFRCTMERDFPFDCRYTVYANKLDINDVQELCNTITTLFCPEAVSFDFVTKRIHFELKFVDALAQLELEEILERYPTAEWHCDEIR